MALVALLKKLWPHWRAAFVLFHLACIFVLAFPAPVGGLDRNNWKLKNVQQEFEAWAAVFHVTEPVFEEFLYQAAVKWMTLRETAARPFREYVDVSGCEQPWRMFVGATRVPARLQIQLRKAAAPADQWDTLYEQDDPDHAWHESMFKQERVRSQIARWSWPGFTGDYDQGCAYISRLAFSERPDAADVRCRFWSVESPTPEQVRNHAEPVGRWIEERAHHRPGGAK